MASASWDADLPRKSGGSLVRAGYYVFMTGFALVYFYPMIWLVLSSFRDNRDIFTTPFALPREVDLGNWAKAWEIGHMSTYAWNSVIVTASTVFGILMFASLASFAFSKLTFKGSKALLAIFVFGLFMPLQSFFIAQSHLFENLNLKDSYLALIIPYIGVGLPLAIFLLKAYLDSIPKELMEAARMDGCNDYKLYGRIVLPLMIPSMATVAIFSALNAWNELLLAMLYVQDEAYKTIPVGLLAFSSRYLTDYKLLFSALSLITIPMIGVYVFFHKYIVSGLTEGSIK